MDGYTVIADVSGIQKEIIACFEMQIIKINLSLCYNQDV